MPLIEEVIRDGKRGLRYHLHPGQLKAWNSEKRTVAVIAGVRSGKTSFGPLWLHREMVRRGPGDYLMVAPTFPLLDNAARPELESLLARQLGLGTGTQRMFLVSEDGHRRLWPGHPYVRPSRVVYGHAQNPESLAALTAKAAWLDEAGQNTFRLASFEEVQRRVSFDRGRILLSTTVYNLGWLKQRVFDPWEQALPHGGHPEIDVVNFKSVDNPAFPRDEYDRAFREWPLWKAVMFMDGRFTRPAGLIYDRFDPRRHVVPRFLVPPEWPRYVGLDFGAVNTAAVFLAAELQPVTRLPTGRFFAYREYRPGKFPPETHAAKLLGGDPARGVPPEPQVPRFVGGARHENDWRDRFGAAGVPVVEPPVKDVEVQIDSLYGLIADDRLVVMDDLTGLLDELASYSRVLDDRGEPTEDIDGDQMYHYLAGMRYLASWLKDAGLAGWHATPADEKALTAAFPAGAFEPEVRAGGGEDADRPRRRRDEDGRMSRGSYEGQFPEW